MQAVSLLYGNSWVAIAVFGSVQGHRSLHPADEDLSAGTPVLGARPLSGRGFGVQLLRNCDRPAFLLTPSVGAYTHTHGAQVAG